MRRIAESWIVLIIWIAAILVRIARVAGRVRMLALVVRVLVHEIVYVLLMSRVVVRLLLVVSLVVMILRRWIPGRVVGPIHVLLLN